MRVVRSAEKREPDPSGPASLCVHSRHVLFPLEPTRTGIQPSAGARFYKVHHYTHPLKRQASATLATETR